RAAAVRVVLGPERHPAVRQALQARVAEGNTVGVAGQVLEHLLRTAERRLAIDDPVRGVQRLPPGGPGTGLGQRPQTTRQEQLALLEETVEAVEELAAKDAAEHAHRQEEAGPAGDPARRRVDLAGRVTGQATP